MKLNKLTEINGLTGNNKQRQLVNLEEKIYAPLAASKGIVYIHTEKDTLYALNAQRGVDVWRPIKLSSK